MKPYGLIKEKLNKEDKICVIACNACARMCETGGEKELNEITEKLNNDGFNVVSKLLVPVACDYDQLKRAKPKGDIFIVLACDAGVFNVKKMFPDKKVIAALDTIGLGAWDESGDIHLVREFK